MKPETRFTASLRAPLIAAGIYPLKLSLSGANGTADCWYSGYKRDLWSEHKFLKTLPPKIDPLKLLTKLQQDWLERRYEEGRNVAVIIGSPKGCVILRGLAWKFPILRDDFLLLAVPKKKLIEELIDYLGAKEVDGRQIPSSRNPRR